MSVMKPLQTRASLMKLTLMYMVIIKVDQFFFSTNSKIHSLRVSYVFAHIQAG